MKTQPLVTMLLVILLIVSTTAPITASVCTGKAAPPPDYSCSSTSLESNADCRGNCPFLDALAEDYVCTASDPAGVVSVVCTVGTAVYKGVRTAAITGAKLAITATSIILSGMVQLGSLISPA
jgi:hypothetical protein